MKDKDYKRAWIELKEELLKKYPRLLSEVQVSGDSCEEGMFYQLTENLLRMDELDGTHEFQNLLSDLERGSDGHY